MPRCSDTNIRWHRGMTDEDERDAGIESRLWPHYRPSFKSADWEVKKIFFFTECERRKNKVDKIASLVNENRVKILFL